MAATATIKGGPELKARLAALGAVPRDFLSDWQSTTTKGARATAPSRTGKGRASIRAGKLSETEAQVRGAFWLIFIDRGTKAHDIEARKAKALHFEYRGESIFTRKAHKKRQRRRPFLTKAAQDALRGSRWSDSVIKAWNRRRAGRYTVTK